MYHVTLSCAGNPDMGQDPDRPLPGVPSLTQTAPSLALARALCQRYIATHELGGGNWTGGAVRAQPDGRLVARVSYNGRVWAPDNETEIVL